jgi:hypothetical protein
MNRTAILTVAVVLAVSGCRRPTGPATPAPAPLATAPADYRTLTLAELEIVVGDHTKTPISLKPAGPNKFIGTRPSPDGTVQLPVTVTVEKERIIVETKAGGLSSREIITPRGMQVENLREN